MNTETWYVMEDDSVGDPREIAPDKDGRLVHKDGRKVAYAAHGPRSRSVNPDAARTKKPASKSKAAAADADEKADETGTEARDLKADEPKRGYKHRESKAE